MVHHFKHMFLVSKQHYTYFYTLFHPHLYKKTENYCLNTRTKQTLKILSNKLTCIVPALNVLGLRFVCCLVAQKKISQLKTIFSQWKTLIKTRLIFYGMFSNFFFFWKTISLSRITSPINIVFFFTLCSRRKQLILAPTLSHCLMVSS